MYTLLGALLLAYLAIQLRWIFTYRQGLLDIDESGYLSVALLHFNALKNGGILAWLSSVGQPSALSPIAPAAASWMFAIFGPEPIHGFLVPVLFGIALVVLSYLLGREVGGDSVGFASAILVATTPLIVIYTRSFQFSIPAATFTTLALLALLKSERASNWRWLVVFGVAVGLMPLARSMAIAFIPAIGVAALVYVGFEADKVWRIRNLAGAGVIAVLTSLTWLAKSGTHVAGYLLSFGYGNRAVEFGPKLSPLDSLLDVIYRLAMQIYLPHFVCLAIGLVAGTAYVATHLRRSTAIGFLRSPVTPLAVFGFLCVIILASTQNKGTAFIAPALPAIYVVAMYGLFCWLRNGAARSIASVAIAAVAIAAFMPLADRDWSVAEARYVDILGSRFIVSRGNGTQEEYEASTGINTLHPLSALPPATVAAWKDVNSKTVDRLASAPTAVGFRSSAYNVNTMLLVELLKTSKYMRLTQIEPVVVGPERASYKDWLATGEAAKACYLLTSPGTQTDFAPYVDTPTLEAAAADVGFTMVDSWEMPNGRAVRLWQRTCPASAR